MSDLPRLAKPIPRDQLPTDVDLCSYCTGKCCRYISIAISRPTTWKDFDTLRWYLTRDYVNIYAEDGQWYVMVLEDCRNLLPDNRCGIYDTRPQVCRDHKTDNCEYEDDYNYERIFENGDQLREYAEALLGPQQFEPQLIPLMPSLDAN